MVNDKKGMRVTTLLDKYKEWVDAGDIQFLKEKVSRKKFQSALINSIP
ncbi:hypothetical protein ACFLV6_02075 [Chloroflexota bacterium]